MDIWSDQSRMDLWLEIELLAVEAWAKIGKIPVEDARQCRQLAHYTVEAVQERERITNHDVAAFVDVVGESVGPSGRWIHYGLTSSDIVDTGFSLQLGIALDEIMAHYPDDRLANAREEARVGALTGAIGNYAHVDPRVEASVLAELGLRPCSATTQIIPRDYFAGVMLTLALVFKEPILHGYARVALDNMVLWHERDISHSSAERVIWPQAFALIKEKLGVA